MMDRSPLELGDSRRRREFRFTGKGFRSKPWERFSAIDYGRQLSDSARLLQSQRHFQKGVYKNQRGVTFQPSSSRGQNRLGLPDEAYFLRRIKKPQSRGYNPEKAGKLLPYSGPFSLSNGKLSIHIESKRYDFHHSGSFHISEMKKGYFRTISVSTTLALWVLESLEHHVMTTANWILFRFEGENSVNINWGSNSFGEFVKITSVFEKIRSTICVPFGARKLGLKFFIKALSRSLLDRNDVIPPSHTSAPSEEIQGGEMAAILTGPPSPKPDWKDPIIDDLVQQPVQKESTIPGLLFHSDINDFCLNENSIDICCKGDYDEEFKILEPLFTEHFESMFEESSCYLREAMTIAMVRDKLQKGILKNGKGKAFRMTRQVTRSIEAVDYVKIRGTKNPVYLIYSNEDSRVIQSCCGEFLQHF
ncbi:hypothetical protein DM860_017824 [Cuscuta australis]|uniref:Uncharacterized protein n=1 Tax=Cuscuta australis TaxID=267555 RepID=A0A328DVF0_9ASTE|nr:hypothetical protein DM860_017824 [Cuscuta australis]